MEQQEQYKNRKSRAGKILLAIFLGVIIFTLVKILTNNNPNNQEKEKQHNVVEELSNEVKTSIKWVSQIDSNKIFNYDDLLVVYSHYKHSVNNLKKKEEK